MSQIEDFLTEHYVELDEVLRKSYPGIKLGGIVNDSWVIRSEDGDQTKLKAALTYIKDVFIPNKQAQEDYSK